MPKGGARARSGPAPTSTDRSHKAKADAQGWTTLPAEGRDGPLPAFPLIDPSARELDLWERLWETPQATMWETLHQDFEVASYVRLLVTAERPRASAIIWSQVKQFAESLGLSVSGMQRNRWTIAPADADDVGQGAGSAPTAQVTNLADRLRAARGE
ncbi:phage terminase small subunit [Streptomyces sp. NPDC003832]